MSDSSTYNTFLNPSAPQSEINRFRFLFRREMAAIRTAMPVQVVAVNATAMTVDVQPMVQQTDGNGNVTDLPVLYGVPYSRWQGGQSGIILDPVVNDLGVICFSDRDASAFVAAKQKSPPGSNRRFSLADGFYVGMVLNPTPTQYLKFDPSTGGVDVVSPTEYSVTTGSGSTQAKLTMNSSGITLQFGSLTFTISSSGFAFSGGDVTGTGAATFQKEGTFNGGHTVSAHHHPVPGVQTGGSTVNSQPPTG